MIPPTKKISLKIGIALLCCQGHFARSQPQPYLDHLYDYIENPAIFEWNQMQGHRPDVIHPSIEKATLHDSDEGINTLSLNGEWKFLYADRPEEIPSDCYAVSFNTQSWHTIEVPGNWEMQGFGDPLFRNIPQPFPVMDPPKVPREYNPTGVYRRQFELPESWRNKHLFLRLEKVASASHIWINGAPVGYNEGAHEPAEYDITPFVQPGINQITVHVVKYSDGVYLEDQDYWRLAGIFDDVWIYATDAIHLYDWQVITDFDEAYENAELTVKADLRNFSNMPSEAHQLQISLFDPQRNKVTQSQFIPLILASSATTTLSWTDNIQSPLQWSAEHPHLYSLTFELIDPKGETVEIISGRIGFRETEIRNQTLFHNGIAVKLNGINSHMQHPSLGHTMNMETMRRDMEIFKQTNINCVRTSHYPPKREYLDLADEYGIYIIDETGDEAHGTEFLSDTPAWEGMYRERVRKMVLRDRNHPSILFWSAGNESGEGDLICAVIDEGRKYDSTRFWMYGGNAFAHSCEDIIGPRYPTPFELKTLVALIPESEDPRPSFMDEYVSVAGNGGGSLDEYWELIRQYPRLMGGAIWDYVSPGIEQPIRQLEVSSENAVPTHIMGNATLSSGYRGKGIDLNGHDQWVEIYQDPSLDLETDKLTIAAWVYPRALNDYSGTFISKGSHQFVLKQSGKDALSFFITTNQRYEVTASLPDQWLNHWHHIAASYDGKTIQLSIDGVTVASSPASGVLHRYPYPVNVGRDAEAHGLETGAAYLADAIIDEVAVYNEVIPVERIMEGNPLAKKSALLWLDFESEQTQGTFYSIGTAARSYGTIWPDRTPQPEMQQIKHSGRPLSINWIDEEQGLVKIKNLHHFSNLNEFNLIWERKAHPGRTITGSLNLDIAPTVSEVIQLPREALQLIGDTSETLSIKLLLKTDKAWAKKGHLIAEEQLLVHFQDQQQKANETSPSLNLVKNSSMIEIQGENFSYHFDPNKGKLTSIKIKETEVLQTGPETNVWRAPLPNEIDPWSGWSLLANPVNDTYRRSLAGEWYAWGLDQLHWKCDSVTVKELGSSIQIRSEYHTQANSSVWPFINGFDATFTYEIAVTGHLNVTHEILPQGNQPRWLPRIGNEWKLFPQFQNITWFGRGPGENYPDRKSGSPVGLYTAKLSDLYEPYLIPQDHGLRTDNRWVRFADDSGVGLEIRSNEPFNFNAYPYTTDHLSRAQYPFQLEPSGIITLNVDYQTTGVGDTARSTLSSYQAHAVPVTFEYELIPLGL